MDRRAFILGGAAIGLGVPAYRQALGDAGESQRAPSTVTQSLPFILTSVALRKAVPSGVGGAMRPPAASRVTLRTSDGRSTAKQRATRLPKA